MKPLVGHLETQKNLNALLESGNMPHALILSGAKGIGKRLIAEQFGRRLLCGPEEGAMFAPEGLSCNESHELYPQIEASASKVPTIKYSTNSNLASIRGNSAKIAIRAALTKKGIDPNQLTISISAAVNGPKYHNDAGSNKVVYEKYQYVFVRERK
ncbi:MAG: hypothetical protein CFH43_00211 [Proteobacteria bacterium]|nr:MAG: hypothetical protein CFH43_00211 [Pseudomonadota bacterium]